MRLISQTGDIDIPYENTSLSRAENIIRAYVPIFQKSQYSFFQKKEKQNWNRLSWEDTN